MSPQVQYCVSRLVCRGLDGEANWAAVTNGLASKAGASPIPILDEGEGCSGVAPNTVASSQEKGWAAADLHPAVVGTTRSSPLPSLDGEVK